MHKLHGQFITIFKKIKHWNIERVHSIFAEKHKHAYEIFKFMYMLNRQIDIQRPSHPVQFRKY